MNFSLLLVISMVMPLVIYSSTASTLSGSNTSSSSASSSTSSAPNVQPMSEPSNLIVSSNDTEITFWTPISSYYDRVVTMISTRIPSNLLSLKTLFGYNLISLAILAASLFISFVFSPNSWLNKLAQFNIGSGVEDLARKVNLAIDAYENIEPEVCLRMAACTLGQQKKSMNSAPSSRPQHHPLLGGIQVLDNLLRLVTLSRHYIIRIINSVDVINVWESVFFALS